MDNRNAIQIRQSQNDYPKQKHSTLLFTILIDDHDRLEHKAYIYSTNESSKYFHHLLVPTWSRDGILIGIQRPQLINEDRSIINKLNNYINHDGQYLQWRDDCLHWITGSDP